MAFAPITFVATNYRDYKNWWLKAYEPGTTTPKPMSDNDTGSPQAAKYEIDKDGWPVTSGSAIVNPYIDGDYDIWLFPTEADADANDTTNALRLADDLSSPGSSIGGYASYEFDTVADFQSGTTIGGKVVTLEVNDTFYIKERGRAKFDYVSGVAGADGYRIISDGTNSGVLRVNDIINDVEWGATGDINQDWSPIASAMFTYANDNGIGQIQLGSGYRRLTETWQITNSINIVGINKGGNGYDSTQQDRTVLVHDFDGDMITFSGFDDVNTGVGGKLSQMDFAQYLGHPNSSNPAFVGGAGACLKFTGTTVSNRSGRIEIDGCAFERFVNGSGSGNDWTFNIDFDGTIVGGSDGIRNFYLSNMRFLAGTDTTACIRARTTFNLYMINCQGDDRDSTDNNKFIISGLDVPSESANINIGNCTGFIYNFDFCRNVNISGGTCETYTSTANTSETTLGSCRVTNIPSTEQPGVKVLATNGDFFIGKIPNAILAKWGRDMNWNDSSNTIAFVIGNINDNQGDTDLFYTNGTNQAGGMRQKFRDQADTGNFIGAQFYSLKEPSSDNCQAIVELNGVTTIRSVQALSTPVNEVNGRWRPITDNVGSLGDASHRWTEVFAVNGTINTSDEREKEQIRDLNDAELRVATNLKSLIKLFKWKSSISDKGESARIHCGVIAQDVKAAFEAEGLNGFDYGVLCYDEWPDEYDIDGNLLTQAGSRYGVRYEELISFIIAAL